MSIDLHLHTIYSDGLRTPEETVIEAKEKNLRAIAITDHDTVAGVARAIDAARGTGLEVIPGVELSCVYKGKELHLLGYYFDLWNESLLMKLQEIRDARVKRAGTIIEKLKSLNYAISLDDFQEEIEKGTIGRLHIARHLVNKSYFHNTKQVFDKLLQSGQAAYVEREKLDVCEMIELILLADGIPVIAHPGIYDYDINWQELLNCGLMGIEAFHSKHSSKNSQYYSKIAEDHGFIITGGSDCHGIRAISSLGSLKLDYNIVERLKTIKYG